MTADSAERIPAQGASYVWVEDLKNGEYPMVRAFSSRQTAQEFQRSARGDIWDFEAILEQRRSRRNLLSVKIVHSAHETGERFRDALSVMPYSIFHLNTPDFPVYSTFAVVSRVIMRS